MSVLDIDGLYANTSAEGGGTRSLGSSAQRALAFSLPTPSSRCIVYIIPISRLNGGKSSFAYANPVVGTWLETLGYRAVSLFDRVALVPIHSFLYQTLTDHF